MTLPVSSTFGCMRASRLMLAALLLIVWMPSSARAGFFSRFVGGGSEEDAETREGAKPPEGSNVNSIVVDGQGVSYSVLRKQARIPLMGYGVGHVHHSHADESTVTITDMVALALQENKMTRLIDTSQASGNEAQIAEGILKGAEKVVMRGGDKLQVHVVTKVWYTHLGYERTKLAVEDSLRAFDSVIKSDHVDLRLHFLLNWPKCFDHFMNCEDDEANVPQRVKDAGPDPNQDRDNAWKGSWKMLEDAYLSKSHPIESIGVSNFNLDHLEEFDTFARVRPRIIQMNVWSLMYDHNLVDYCHKHGIHTQAYNVMEGTLSKPENAPHAYHHLQNVAIELTRRRGDEDVDDITPAQVVFAWLTQHGVSVAPRTLSTWRLSENSGKSISSVPELSEGQVQTVAHAVVAYLDGSDLEADTPVSVTYKATTRDMMVYWRVSQDSEVRLALVKAGQKYNETTYPGHAYRLYDAHNKDVYVDHVVEAHLGYHDTVNVDLEAGRVSLASQAESESLNDPTAPGFNRVGSAMHQEKL